MSTLTGSFTIPFDLAAPPARGWSLYAEPPLRRTRCGYPVHPARRRTSRLSRRRRGAADQHVHLGRHPRTAREPRDLPRHPAERTNHLDLRGDRLGIASLGVTGHGGLHRIRHGDTPRVDGAVQLREPQHTRRSRRRETPRRRKPPSTERARRCRRTRVKPAPLTAASAATGAIVGGGRRGSSFPSWPTVTAAEPLPA